MIKRNPPEWDHLLREQAKPRTGLHVTDCLGCPRRLAGLREGWEVDLSSLDARLAGSIVHLALSRVNPDTAEVHVSGPLVGVSVVGSIDRLEFDERGTFTCDYKTSEDDKPGRVPSAPYPDQAWQQEAYRYLLSLRGGLGITVGWRIYYRRGGKWAMYEHIGPVWTLEALAAFRPHDGAFTTAEIASQCVSDLPAAQLPLVGASQKIGAGSACSYCEVEGPCNNVGSEVEL